MKNLNRRVDELEASAPELSDNVSNVYIYNPENKKVIHTKKTRMPKNVQAVHLYLPDNGRE